MLCPFRMGQHERRCSKVSPSTLFSLDQACRIAYAVHAGYDVDVRRALRACPCVRGGVPRARLSAEA